MGKKGVGAPLLHLVPYLCDHHFELILSRILLGLEEVVLLLEPDYLLVQGLELPGSLFTLLMEERQLEALRAVLALQFVNGVMLLLDNLLQFKDSLAQALINLARAFPLWKALQVLLTDLSHVAFSSWLCALWHRGSEKPLFLFALSGQYTNLNLGLECVF